MAKHTPAPWVVKNCGIDDTLVLTIMKDSVSRICFMATPGEAGDPEVIKADARLITAAPDLFEAALRLEMAELAHANCEECGESPELAPECCAVCFPLFDDARVMRRNAIAKACGTTLTSAESQPNE